MFSGIIQTTAPVISAKEHEEILRIQIGKPRGWKLALGASVAIDGICSTVVARSVKSFDVEYMPETLSKTTAGTFTKGMHVNLERSLKLSDTLDGHFVAGHVDARADIVEIKKRGRATDMSIQLPRDLLQFVVPQGSIAINGVSLTVARVKNSTIVVALIPHTLSHTNLGSLRRGDTVNVEVDLLARYLAAQK